MIQPRRLAAIIAVPETHQIYLFSEEGDTTCDAPTYTNMRLAFSQPAQRN